MLRVEGSLFLRVPFVVSLLLLLLLKQLLLLHQLVFDDSQMLQGEESRLSCVFGFLYGCGGFLYGCAPLSLEPLQIELVLLLMRLQIKLVLPPRVMPDRL